MTIEKLLGMSADELDALTPKQKEEYFSKYLPITRPELAIKPEKHGPKIVHKELSKKELAQQILLQHGFKVKL